MSAVAEAIRNTLQDLEVRDCAVCVALSGGIDSVSLLDGLLQIGPARGLRLSALHVNHGLSPHASSWEAFCRALCDARGITLSCVRVRVERESGSGLEAAARIARYAVFAESDADFVALAHHLDDQVETFLIQLLRGAGARGLSAMPVLSRIAGHERKDDSGPGAGRAFLLRPLLKVSRTQIDDYAKARGLEWVEDESNLDTALDRNFLRREVLPLFASRFPGYRETLVRSARNLADSAALADDLARIDWQSVLEKDGIRMQALKELPRVRALNVLRHAFDRKGLPMPPRARLEEALRQCLEAAPDSRVRVRFGAVTIRRHRGRITLIEEGEEAGNWQCAWKGEDTLALPHGLGWLNFRRTTGEGISRTRLDSAPVSVRFRRGGERLSLGPGRPRRRLKHLLQEADVPEWERGRMPLLFCGDRLAWVPGIGVAADCAAHEREPAVRVEWQRVRAPDPKC
jgi:tRNA(Ile)-lysidine synthase